VELLEEINKVIHAGGVNAYAQDVLKRCHKEIRNLRSEIDSLENQLDGAGEVIRGEDN